MKTILRIFTLLFGVLSFAQTTVTGTVNDENGMPVPGANVIVVGTYNGAISDFDGKFTLSVSQAPPFTVQASSVGFTTVTENITSNNQKEHLPTHLALLHLFRSISYMLHPF